MPGNPSVIVDDGYINFDKVVFDPEIAFIQHRDQIFVYVAYYVTRSYFGLGSNGHYYDVYRWDSGTLTPISVENLLSGEINYGRISIDALDFSKQNSRSSQVFTSYHKKIPAPYTLSEVLHKHALSPASYSTFSDFKSLNHNSSLHFDLYPNPSSVGTQIKLLEFNDGVLNLSCSDLSGQVLFTINGQLELINSQLLNEVSKLISGQYIITLSQGKSQFSQKFIKQ